MKILKEPGFFDSTEYILDSKLLKYGILVPIAILCWGAIIAFATPLVMP